MHPAAPSEVRAQIDHPVIDGDGHTLEYFPALESYLRAEGVDPADEMFVRRESGSLGPARDWYALSPEQRRFERVGRGPWSGAISTSAADIATSVLPGLLYDRLPDLGVDVSIVYPSYGLLFPHFEHGDVRQASCRALNTMNAELYQSYGDRLIPAALIPMHTPEEAIEELDHAVATLGFKVIVMAGFVQRPIDSIAAKDPDLARWALWSDTFGHDSAYDYDPVWQRCRELKVSPSFHSGAMGWQNRRSTTSYVFNHIGMLGESNHAVAKSLFLGGVTRRFPDLSFGFLEGGVAWGASLLADLVGHFEKRSAAILTRHDPEAINYSELSSLYQRYGGDWADGAPAPWAYTPEDLAFFDEFEACGVESIDDIVSRFVPSFFFGCEADDPMVTTAYNTKANPGGSRLSALFGSDFSHWDVPDMHSVLGETWELVEHELITTADYRDFVFGSAARFFTRANPAFFDGTPIADAVAAETASVGE
jgi:predicted TIM-barrel fold metal-dependent hydrolase